MRDSPDQLEFEAVAAWRPDARNAVALVLAAWFERRPDVVVFVAARPLSKWGAMVCQITPSLIVGRPTRQATEERRPEP